MLTNVLLGVVGIAIAARSFAPELEKWRQNRMTHLVEARARVASGTAKPLPRQVSASSEAALTRAHECFEAEPALHRLAEAFPYVQVTFSDEIVGGVDGTYQEYQITVHRHSGNLAQNIYVALHEYGHAYDHLILQGSERDATQVSLGRSSWVDGCWAARANEWFAESFSFAHIDPSIRPQGWRMKKAAPDFDVFREHFSIDRAHRDNVGPQRQRRHRWIRRVGSASI